MLNIANKNLFFENCLVQCGLTDGRLHHFPLFDEIKNDEKICSHLIRTLEDIRAGADALYEKGKPAENTLGLDMLEWERQWQAWSVARSAAFHSRAALFMLGERRDLNYFLVAIQKGQNAVFFTVANDLMQHASGHYISGYAEELSRDSLASYWHRYYDTHHQP